MRVIRKPPCGGGGSVLSRSHRYRRNRPPLSLTSEQLAMVTESAEHIPVERRDAFMHRVMLGLRASGQAAFPSDRMVSSALEHAFDEFGHEEDDP